MRSLLRGLAGAALVLGLAALGTGPAGLFAQDKKAPAKKPDDKARDEAREKTVGFATSDGLSLNGYWFQGTAADKNPPDAVLMFPAPGNKINDAWIGLANELSKKNFSVLLFDWRGCGINSADAAGARVLDNKALFWREPYNQRILERSKALIEEKGLDYRHLVNRGQGNLRYRDFLFNDLLAARFFLDKQNDNGKCNSGRIWIVTEKDGGHMALAFIATEFPRNSIYDPMGQVFAANKQFRSAGKDFVGLVVLSFQPTNPSASGVFSAAKRQLTGAAGRDAEDHLQRRMAMIMVHGKKEGANYSKAAFGLVGAGGDVDALKQNYKYLREMDNSKATKSVSGIDLIDPKDSYGTQADIVKAMTEVSKVLPGNKDKTEREANKMTVVPRFNPDLWRR